MASGRRSGGSLRQGQAQPEGRSGFPGKAFQRTVVRLGQSPGDRQPEAGATGAAVPRYGFRPAVLARPPAAG
jgi:hypothetical protein